MGDKEQGPYKEGSCFMALVWAKVLFRTCSIIASELLTYFFSSQPFPQQKGLSYPDAVSKY